MKLQFKAMGEEEVRENCYPIEHRPRGYDAINSCNAPINLDDTMHAASSNVRTYFKLSHPVINTALAGSGLGRVYALLGLKNNIARDIASFKLVYDTSSGKYLSAKDIPTISCSSILAGGDYIKYLIDNMTEDKFNKIAGGLILAKLRDKTCLNTYFGGAKCIISRSMHEDVTDNQITVHLFDNVYLNATFKPDNKSADYFKESTPQQIMDDAVKILTPIIAYAFRSGDSTASKAIALSNRSIKEIKDFFYSMLAFNIVIVPKSMRPAEQANTSTRHDPLEVMYNDVYEANSTLATTSINEDNITYFIDRYRGLSMKVSELLREADPRKKERKAIMQKLTGKGGQIRGTNLGKRIDYSARSVIIVNPNMSLENIGLPKSIAPKIFKYHVLNNAKENIGTVDSGNVPREIIKRTGAAGEAATVRNIEAFDILNNVPVVIGRQPTLHKGSMTGFKPLLTDCNAIELNPLCVPPFNADFDGDTMWATVPLSDEAIEEAKTLMYITNNLFWAKDGAPTIMPRQEIIYGLNVCSRGWDGRRIASNIGTLTPSEAFKQVIYNKRKVYETVTGPTGEKTTVGRMAIKHCLGDLYMGHTVTAHNVYTGMCPICGRVQMHKGKNESVINTITCTEHPDIKLVYIYKSYVKVCSMCHTESEVVNAYAKNQVSSKKAVKAIDDKYMADSELQRAILNVVYDIINIPKQFYKDISEKLTLAVNMDTSSMHETIISSAMTPDEIRRIQNDNRMTRLMKNASVLNDLNSDVFDAVIADVNNEATFAITSKINTVGKCTGIAMDVSTKSSYVNIVNDFDFTSYFGEAIGAAIEESCDKCATLTNKNIINYVLNLLVKGKQQFVTAIDRMVQLGFAAAKYYAPPLNVLSKVSYRAEVEKFHKSVAKLEEMYSYGYIEAENFSIEYAEELDKLNKSMKDLIEDKLTYFDGERQLKNFLKALKPSDKEKKYDEIVKAYNEIPDTALNRSSYRSEFKQFLSYVADLANSNKSGSLSAEDFTDECISKLAELKLNVDDIFTMFKSDEHINGFFEMVISGARGSINNLVQIYGYKGRVQKSSTESFDAVIESSYTTGLKPFEHFMSAYGARRGIMDRSLETANIGYASRKLWHATQSMVIREEDCGTDQCITITRSMLSMLDLPLDNASRRPKENAILVKFLTGRYDRHGFITKDRAQELVETQDSFEIRSPITCRKPCCQKCYGRDPSTQGLVVVGTPVGIVAAESLGETAQQLTMRTFQSGGTAKKDGIGSAFEHMECYTELKSKENLPNYEPTAPVSGSISTKVNKNNLMTVLINNKSINVAVPEGTPLKLEVRKGDGIFKNPGDRYIPEIIANSDVVNGALYFTMKLYSIFRSQCDMNLKHFEILAASMMRAIILDGKGTPLHTGCLYSVMELNELMPNGWDNVPMTWCMISITDIPVKSSHAVTNVDFEEVGNGLFNALLYERVETFTDPIEQLVFGQRLKVGSEVNPNYIAERTGSDPKYRISEDICR